MLKHMYSYQNHSSELAQDPPLCAFASHKISHMLQTGQDTADSAGSLFGHLLIRDNPARAAAALRLSSCSMLHSYSIVIPLHV